jgi:hypothetical protein
MARSTSVTAFGSGGVAICLPLTEGKTPRRFAAGFCSLFFTGHPGDENTAMDAAGQWEEDQGEKQNPRLLGGLCTSQDFFGLLNGAEDWTQNQFV